jgi:TonB-dependent siderophore receptor
MLFKKTLLAAAVASFALPVRATDPQLPDVSSEKSNGQDNTPLDTITVTGERVDEGFKVEDQRSGKLPMSIRETPQSVSVITAESLEQRQVINLMQALELSAGVTQYSGNGPFAGQPSFGFNQTTIRGIAIDDLYDFRDDGFVSGSFFAIPDLGIYERIEVIKGANSVLYGRGSVGGIINRIRKKPLAERRTDVELSVGSFDTRRVELDMTGALGDSKTARGRFIAVFDDSGSFVDGAETQRTVLAPSVEFDLTASTRLLLQALRQTEDIVPNTGMPLRVSGDGFDAPNISRSQLNGVAARNPYQWTIESAQAQLEHALDDRWLATLRLSVANTDTPIKVDAYTYGFRETGDDPDTPEIERRGDTRIIGSEHFIDRDIWSGELRLTGEFEVGGRAVKTGFGAEVNDNAYSRRGAYQNIEGFSGTSTEFNLYDGNFERPTGDFTPGADFGGDPRATGYYAQAQISATERLKVLLGARYDEVKLRSYSGDAPIDEETVSDVTGRVGLTFDLNQNASLYTLYAQSFSPVLFDFDQNGKLLDPETGDIYEVGAKTEWFDRRLGVNAAVYRVDRDKVPVGADVPPGDDPFSISSGLQRSEGFEIEINGRPLPGWDLSLAYNQVDSAFKDPRDPFFGIQPGGTPDWQLGIYSGYEIQNGPLKDLGFGASLFAIDDRGVSTFVAGTIPGYERVDLHASYKGLRKAEIHVVVRNITDERYVEGADRKNNYAQFGSPTAVLLSLRYRLGAT